MRRIFRDTLLTRTILIVVVAVVVANMVAVISFRIVSTNIFDAMQRSAKVEAAMTILELAATEDSAAAFMETAVRQSNVLSVQLNSSPDVEAGDWSDIAVRKKLNVSADSPYGTLTSFRTSNAPRNTGMPIRTPRGPGGPAGAEPPDRNFPGDQFGSGLPPLRKEGGPAGRFHGGPVPGFGNRSLPPLFLSMSVEFEDAEWVNLVLAPTATRKPPIEPFIFVLTLSMFAVAVAAGFAARWLYRPLNAVEQASRALSKGEKHPPLPVSGPQDVRNVMLAFNAMVSRMEATLHSQKDVLLAIGHDLRTPLTSLRIRVAMMEDATERAKMERALDELQNLTEAALQAGRISLRTDEKHVTDLGALVESLCEDLRDLNMPAEFEEPEGRVLVPAWPDDLTRAVRNVVLNAIQYGERARVRLSADASLAYVTVSDDGPGIPESQLEAVFEPLVRIEKSRNAETGGHGLGLHISRNIIIAHGGRFELANSATKGLIATISIPRALPGSTRKDPQ